MEKAGVIHLSSKCIYTIPLNPQVVELAVINFHIVG